MRAQSYKKAIQTMTTIPHFINWVVIGGIFKILLDPDYGWINSLIVQLGGQSVYFLGDPQWFPFMYVLLSLWKGVGWGTILYLATMPRSTTRCIGGGDRRPGRWRQTWPVTLPLKRHHPSAVDHVFQRSSRSVDSMFILANRSNRDVSLVLEYPGTTIPLYGSGDGHSGLSSSLSLFKLAFGAVMTIIVNETAKTVRRRTRNFQKRRVKIYVAFKRR
jgi:putative aldouronate transport system permease protein